MKTRPPQVLFDYFTSVNERRLSDAANCFAFNAVVHDESHNHVGAEAIRHWIENTTTQYQPHSQVMSVDLTGPHTFTVMARVSGTFPGSPVELRFTFVIAVDQITHLSVQ